MIAMIALQLLVVIVRLQANSDSFAHVSPLIFQIHGRSTIPLKLIKCKDDNANKLV
jgi:hypothetical protein